MFLKNYTSDVPISQTIYRIEQVLLTCGVTGISKEYGIDSKLTAITFRLIGPGDKPLHIRLPANEKAATKALFSTYVGTVKRPRKTEEEFEEQGARTAWRIVKDWVEVQMSMIQMGQADAVEVFLPYLYDGKRTYYNALKESNFAGLLEYKGKKS